MAIRDVPPVGQPSRATAAWEPPAPLAGRRTRRFRFGLTSAATEKEAPLQPGANIGAQERYRIEEFLGQGGMGRVYAATRGSDGKSVALKVMRQDRLAGDLASEHLARFRQETAAAARIGHPGIIETYAFERTPDGEVLIAMELLRGESLDEWLSKPGRLSVGLNLLAGFADALDAAHRSQIVHRDIKPANLFIQHRDDGSIQPKILDFGLAKMSKPDNTQIETAAGTVLGTPYYLAPERALGKPLSPAADLYSFGVILYEMLTGSLPFDADNFMDILALHIRKPPLDPRQAVPDREVPDGVARLAMVLLAKEPADRPRSAADVAARIRRLLQTEAEVIGAYATGPRVHASAEAATMHLHGVHDRPTTAPVDTEVRWADAAVDAEVQANAPTIAPQASPHAGTMPAVPALVPAEGSVDPLSPMTAFASGEVPKRTKIETTYGKESPKRKATRGTPLWWLPLGAGLGVAVVVAWFFATRVTEAPAAEPEAREPAAAVDAVKKDEPAPAAVGAPPPESTKAEPEAEEAEIATPPEVAEPEPERTPTRETKKGSRPGRKKAKEAEAAPKPEPEPEPKPEPQPKKVDNDPKNWRIDD